ncbi:MAG TPA: hypothetical protein VM409_08130 [Chloroflexia bacterium]|nr:hypothetical protein [Chloroflexia bacterium]
MSDQEQQPQPERRGHARRPPLAEIDSWELWQAWKRGDRETVVPWLGLLGGFCVVLAAMYSFFFFSTSLNDDRIAQVGLVIILAVFMYVLWRRISPRRDFSLAVVALIAAVSAVAFLIWLLAYGLSGWNPIVAVLGTIGLGLAGLGMSLPSLNAIARRQEESKT